MNKLLVTETADMLCYKAEKDIMTVDTLYTKPKYPEDKCMILFVFMLHKLLKNS